MKWENQIINTLNENFNDLVKKHEEHKERVLNALDWWEEHFVLPPPTQSELEEDEIKFTGSTLVVDGVKCRCVYNNLSGFPLFSAEFHLRPLNMDDDIGCGRGAVKVFSF